MGETTDELLAKAAVFLAQDDGATGFLDRFTKAVSGNARLLSHALDQARRAQVRAGHASIWLAPGDLRVGVTSTGASLTACALPAGEGRVAAAVRLVDVARRPLEGAALRVTTPGEDCTVVTDHAGWAHIGGTGPGLQIRIGRGQEGAQETATRHAGTSVTAGIIELPRDLGRDELELAAAHDGGTPDTDEADRWRVEAGGVEFLCQKRKDGYDLTALVTGVTAAFVQSVADVFGVWFWTHDRDGRSRCWIVPLYPSPLGLAGSLYGTDEYSLDSRTVEVGAIKQFIAALGDGCEEVLRRSVRHCDKSAGWAVVCERLDPGLPRTAVEAGLAEHESYL